MSVYVTETYQDDVTTVLDETYNLVTGTGQASGTWFFNIFSAGAELADGSSKIEIFWDVDGNADANMVLIDAIYTASETYSHALDSTVGYTFSTGNEAVRVRRTVLGGTASRQVYAQFQGFTA